MDQPDFSELAKSMEEAITPKPMQCPHCSKEIRLRNVAMLPPKQIFTMRFESSTGSFCARTIGESITSIDKILKSIARQMGGGVEVFIESLERGEKSVTVGFLITEVPDKDRKSAKR